jgi:hypothetical protein
VSKKISTLFISLFLVFGNVSVYAQTAPFEPYACNSREVLIVFFNGIQNTEYDARSSLEKLKEFYGNTTYGGDMISYEFLYNDTIGILEDIVEVLDQRMGELKDEYGMDAKERYELFFDIIMGDGPWYKTALSSIRGLKVVADAIFDEATTMSTNKIVALLNSSPTSVNYAEHKARLDNWVLEGKKMLFVAHSQGNLFANPAYDYVKNKTGYEDSIQVVHIAPASVKTNGRHVLADWDLVIGVLSVAAGNLPKVTNDIPPPADRPAGVNGQTDSKGHGFVEIYINPNLEISEFVKTYIGIALDSLKAPPAQAQTGLFTATLTWDGEGDVDLHVYEPDDTWVYYGRKSGKTGYLDVDNMYANGPEHYYASCDINKLQTGKYTVKVANFSGAKDRIATVQIVSQENGVLGTKRVTLGEATRSTPAYDMFNVFVLINEKTGEYTVSLSL